MSQPFSMPGEPPAPTVKKKSGLFGRGDKTSKPVTKKAATGQLKIAVVVAVVGAVIVGLTLSGGKAPDTFVVRTTETLAASTVVSKADKRFEAVPIDSEYVEKGAYTGSSVEAAIAAFNEDVQTGVRTQQAIPAKGQVTRADFSADLLLDRPLESDERLMSIQASIANAASGIIRPGDRVDIAASVGGKSGIVLPDVEIVAVTVSEAEYQAAAAAEGTDKDASPMERLPSNPIPGLYTVRIPADMVATLLAVSSGATLTLIYGPEDATRAPTTTMSAEAVLCASAPTGAPGC